MFQFVDKIASAFEIDVFLILIFCSITLSNLGVFLVLKKVSMVIDAISHSVLLGIVTTYLILQYFPGNNGLDSSWLIIGATLIGILTVFLIEFISKNPKISKDSANGIVFTFFFSLAIIIISMKIRNVHIDTDAVFLGNIELVHISQLYKIIPILILSLFFVFLFYKELKIFIFDPYLTNILGFSSVLINYSLMTLTSLTAVISFDIVGSIMTIVCMIGPAATSILLNKNLLSCWGISLWLSFISTVIGYCLGIYWDLPVAGLISVVILVIFLIVLVLEPNNGIIAKIIKNHFHKKSFMIIILLLHLENHFLQKQKNYLTEVKNDLKWSSERYQTCLKQAIKSKYIIKENQELILTDYGRNYLYKKNKSFDLNLN